MNAGIGAVKFLGAILIGGSTDRVISQIIKNNVTAVSRPEKIRLSIASFVVSAMVADKVTDYANDWFDGMLVQIDEAKKKWSSSSSARSTWNDATQAESVSEEPEIVYEPEPRNEDGISSPVADSG